MRARNPEYAARERARSRARYLANREAIIADQRQRDAARADEKAAYNKAYAQANRDRLRQYRQAYDIEWRRRNPGKTALYSKAWRERDRTKARRLRREAQQRRRAQMATSDIGLFTELQVFERDGWTCWICDEPVERMPYRKRAPRMASVDHVVPLARGGSHTLDNVRCTHLDCNRRRGLGGY